MSICRSLDDFLLDNICQPITDWISQKWGIGHLRLARIMLHTTAILVIIMNVMDYRDKMFDVTNLLGILFLIVLASEIHKIKGRDGIEKSSMALPIARLQFFITRIIFLFFTIMQPIFTLIAASTGSLPRHLDVIVASNVCNVTCLLGFYLLACRSNPPKQPQTVWSRITVTT
jgi:ABC-type transport system involved in multi-copper enzyme maturation permease subunit